MNPSDLYVLCRRKEVGHSCFEHLHVGEVQVSEGVDDHRVVVANRWMQLQIVLFRPSLGDEAVDEVAPRFITLGVDAPCSNPKLRFGRGAHHSIKQQVPHYGGF